MSNSVRANRSLEAYCDSSGDNNEGAIEALAYHSLAAEVDHNNNSSSTNSRFKKDSEESQNQKVSNGKNLSTRPRSPSKSHAEENGVEIGEKNQVTSSVKSHHFYSCFGRRSVGGLDQKNGDNHEFGSCSNTRDSSTDCKLFHLKLNQF